MPPGSSQPDGSLSLGWVKEAQSTASRGHPGVDSGEEKPAGCGEHRARGESLDEESSLRVLGLLLPLPGMRASLGATCSHCFLFLFSLGDSRNPTPIFTF